MFAINATSFPYGEFFVDVAETKTSNIIMPS